jgi:DNA-binding MarR family transcriptional regulator
MAGSEERADRFSALEGDAWGGLLGVHGRLMRLLERDLEERCGISHPEFEILLRLDWAEGHRARQQDLAAASVLTRSGASRAVERLERLGLVQRETAPEDHRGNYVVLMPAGSELLGRALDGHVPLVRATFLRCFSDDELRGLAASWRRVESGLEARDEPDRRRRRGVALRTAR